MVGAGTRHVLTNGAGSHYPAEIFNPDELLSERTFELPPVDSSTASIASRQQTKHQWHQLGPFPAAVDFFMYDDGYGNPRSVHMDTEKATSSLEKIKSLKANAKDEDIEIIIAHDKGWMEKNECRFLPGTV